jgi:bacillithiol system protein YtxJ
VGYKDMGNKFIKVTGAEQFTDLINRSQEQLVVIFKHSTTCPVSAAAYDEMEQFAGEVVLVEVQRARALSVEIEKRTGIRHESPQVLVLENGKVVWNASHFKVKAQALAEALQRAGNHT